MNILYIDHYAGSLSMGMEFRPYYLAREFNKLGHKVRILAADYSHLRKQNPESITDFQCTNVDGIEFQWIHTSKYSGNGAKRAITMFQFCTKLFINTRRILHEFKPDVVISSSTYPLDSYPAKKLARISGAIFVHETHDLWPLTLTTIGGMSKWHPFVIAMAISERHAYKTADKVIGILPKSYIHMLKKGLSSKSKFCYIPNGIVADDWENAKSLNSDTKKMLDKIKRQFKKIIMYAGGIELSDSLDTFLDAARLSSTSKAASNVAFVMVGRGTLESELLSRIKTEKISNAFIIPAVPKTEVPSLLRFADFLYIGLKKNPLYKYGISLNKIYDYMMSGKPVISAIEAANCEITEFNAGINTNPDDPKAILDTLAAMLNMPESKLEKMGESGKNAVLKNYDYEILAKRFLEFITL